MSVLVAELAAKALKLNIPLSVQLDLTYRCNERCVHCYLDHHDHGEMTTAEIKDLLDQMADAGVFYLTISGGEIMMRRDFFEILEYARLRTFCVKLKTNGILIRKKEADRIKALGVETVQISIYSHIPEVHDAITKLPGSLEQSIEAIRLLRAHGLNVVVANVVMTQNVNDYLPVRALAAELGAQFFVDPTITPMMDGDRSILNLNVDEAALREVFRNEALVGNVEEFCAPPLGPDEDALDMLPCSAGHTACYVSPYGDVYPCVQFPLPSGNVRRTKFVDIWRDSPQLQEVRSITLRDMPSCSKCTHGGTCTRCPGLAYLEGNMRGPSSQDCEKSFARTGIPSENLKARKAASRTGPLQLVQIQGLQPSAQNFAGPVPEDMAVTA
ncbi:MAG: radical SAM protein [Candidatus Acidiferrales bacterium]|jgi:radical SAM protein with 4Fe4S-binding SPASM domain